MCGASSTGTAVMTEQDSRGETACPGWRGLLGRTLQFRPCCLTAGGPGGSWGHPLPVAPCAAPRATFPLLSLLRHCWPHAAPQRHPVRVRPPGLSPGLRVLSSAAAGPTHLPPGLHGFMLPDASPCPVCPPAALGGSPALACCLADACLPAETLSPPGCSALTAWASTWRRAGRLVLAERLPGLVLGPCS